MEQQQELVTFDQDKAIVAEHYPGEMVYSARGLQQHTDAAIHSVVSFLRRPQLISQFSWSVNASRSENLLLAASGNGLLIPRDVLTTQYLNKLDGFTSMKATCVVKLEVNAQPFMAGRLIMVAAPMPTILGRRKDFLFSTVGQAQCVNHVQMDIAKQTEVELKIPFISPYNSYDLIDGKFDWAELRVLVYSPLNSTEAKSLECLIWVHFEDIELGYPTSGLPKARQQSGKVQAKREQESKGESTGAMGELGGRLVAGISRTINGVTDVAGSLASILGWSKPILAKPGCTVLNRPTEGFANLDGVDHSYVLAVSTGNAVDYYPNLSSTALDETSFEFLKRIPQFIGVFEYSQSSAYGTKLWECAISPSTVVPACYYIKQEGLPTLSWKQPTTLNYITSPFLYWTGSLVYTFRFVKTDYHSGRVEVSFHPFVTQVNNERMDYVYKAVVDLRTNAEVSITVPYVSPQQWKRINTYLDPVNPNPPKPGRTKDVITGILYVRALTPLLCANSIIGPKIEVLVEMRAGADFLVHAPITSRYLPFSFDVPKQQGAVLPAAGFSQYAAKTFTKDGGSMSMNVQGLDMAVIELDIKVFNWGTDNVACYFDVSNNIRTDTGRCYMSGSATNYKHRFVADLTQIGGMLNVFVAPAVISRGTPNNARVQVEVILTPATFWPNPYPTTLMGQGEILQVEGIATINKDQLPLPVSGSLVSGTDPLSVKGTVSVDRILVDDSQLPLPVKNNKGFPLSIAQEEGDELKVYLTGYDVDDEKPLRVQMDGNIKSEIVAPIPLPISGGGGGGTGSVVEIDPNSLPLWVSNYPKDQPLPKQQSFLNRLIGVAGTTETRTNAIEGWLPPSISGLDPDIHRDDTRMICSGEKIDTVRQLTRRFAYSLVNSLSSKEDLAVSPVEMIRPGILVERKGGTIPQYALYATNSKSEVSGSPLSFYAAMYAFYRGGLRLKVWLDPRTVPQDLVSMHLEYSTQESDANVIDDNIENFMTPIAYELPKIKQMGEYQIPYYSPTALSSHWAHAKDNQFDTPILNAVIAVPSGVTDNKGAVKVAAAAADDLDLQTFIGPPPVINILDLTVTKRQLHYPPSGFTPTQNVTDDPDNPEKPATGFTPIPYTSLMVRNNALGASCPHEPAMAGVRQKRKTDEQADITQDMQSTLVTRRLLSTLDDYEGNDEVDYYPLEYYAPY